MAKAPKNYFETLYDKAEAGALVFDRREDVEPAIQGYLSIIAQVREDLADNPDVAQGLQELEYKLQALRLSTEPLPELQKRLAQMVNVPIGPGKTLPLDAFRRTSSKSTLANTGEYQDRVAKLVENTLGNLTQLLITWPDDTILQHFMKTLQEVGAIQDYGALKVRMDEMRQSPMLWYYNDKKKEFLLAWLKPFQELLGKPLAAMSDQEMVEALRKVDTLRERKLSEMTNLTLINEMAPYRAHNHVMHEVMNGKNANFWGSNAVRDEFVALMSKVVTQYSFDLDDHFLVFKTKDEQFAYLVGFSDDAFSQSTLLKEGRVALYPHLKVFLRDAGGNYHELVQTGQDSSAYYKTLKTAVVPFLVAISTMVQITLSPDLKAAFDMWI